jgi:hypothetical protein
VAHGRRADVPRRGTATTRAAPCPHSITSLWRSATTTMRATPRRSASRWPSSPLFSTGSDATNRRPPSPSSRSVLCLRRRSPKSQRDHPPPRRPRRPDLRIARPQGRDDDHRRHGDLRIRPNRPGPNRTRTPWLSCASRVSNARAAQHPLNRLQQSVRPRPGIPSLGSRPPLLR